VFLGKNRYRDKTMSCEKCGAPTREIYFNAMTINSRSKGAGAEREFTNIIYQWSGIRLIRNLQQTRSGGFDLLVHPEAAGQVADSFRSLAVECKRYSKVSPALIKLW
jgi:hypothetical protein